MGLSPLERVYGLRNVSFKRGCVVRILKSVVVDEKRWCLWKARCPTRDAARAFPEARFP